MGDKLQILPGSAQDEVEEAYVLVCAGSKCSDQVKIQLLLAEYIDIKQFFPACSPIIGFFVQLAKLSEALRRLLVMELIANLN